MEVLSQFTPAETYLITHNKEAAFKELLKYTLTDLFIRKVLKVAVIEDDLGTTADGEPIKQVAVGPNFKGYKAKEHELVFLETFIKVPSLKIVFRQLVKSGYQEAKSRKHYIYKLLFQRNEIAKSINNGFFNRLFVNTSLTDYGKQKKKELDKALKHLETTFANLIKSDPNTALKVLRQINGNILLLKSFDLALLSEIDDELTNEMTKHYAHDNDYFAYFDDFDTDFDAGFDDGGGGDSGCSGCSGCGGCGGCGG